MNLPAKDKYSLFHVDIFFVRAYIKSLPHSLDIRFLQVEDQINGWGLFNFATQTIS